MNKERLRAYLRHARILHLLTAILLYALSVGIAHYLGQRIDPKLYLIGQAWLTALQLGSYYLGEHLETPAELGLLNRPPYGQPRTQPLAKEDKEKALFTSAILLALVAALTALLIFSGYINIPLALIMSLLFLGFIAPVIPAARISNSAYSELITTISLVILPPAFGLLLQTGELHRLLAISTFPLSALHLAMLIIFQFPSYAADTVKHKNTLLTRLDWQKAIQIHNLLIITAFLLIGTSVFFDFPPSMILPIFLVLPFAAFQIWHMLRISQGAPTHWKALTLNALITFAFTAYLFTYIFWTR